MSEYQRQWCEYLNKIPEDANPGEYMGKWAEKKMRDALLEQSKKYTILRIFIGKVVVAVDSMLPKWEWFQDQTGTWQSFHGIPTESEKSLRDFRSVADVQGITKLKDEILKVIQYP